MVDTFKKMALAFEVYMGKLNCNHEATYVYTMCVLLNCVCRIELSKFPFLLFSFE